MMSAISIIRTNSENREFLELVRLLDAELAIRDGEDHAFYDQYNKVTMIKYCVVAFENQTPVGCGAIKELDAESIEVKRMFTPPEQRGKGVAMQVLGELEKWAAELGYKRCVLETGKKQPEAIALYTKCGYSVISKYGQYIGIDNSVCFEKVVEHLTSHL